MRRRDQRTAGDPDSSRRRARRRRGIALLEAIVSLAIVGTMGTAAIVLAADVARSVDRARDAEREVARANALLEAAALWPREDLDRRLGDRRQGPWRMRIDRPEPTLYVVSIADTVTGAMLLGTTVYRREPQNAEF